jgi:hypothetical protein
MGVSWPGEFRTFPTSSLPQKDLDLRGKWVIEAKVNLGLHYQPEQVDLGARNRLYHLRPVSPDLLIPSLYNIVIHHAYHPLHRGSSPSN